MVESVENQPNPVCQICSEQMTYLMEKSGSYVNDLFKFFQCLNCNFVSVVNPITDYDRIYNDAYYEGRGADPFVDYAFELDHPERTVRIFEWRGILDAVRHHYRQGLDDVRWLDYGSGTGGLVRFLRDRRIDAFGFDVSGYADRARGRGVQSLAPTELAERKGSFDIVSLIEVLEHIPDPVSLLKTVRDLLRPGGLLFLTTGNADPHRRTFASWEYVVPEIHVSYFSPKSLRRALDRADLQPFSIGRNRGLSNIIKYKVLKTLGIKHARPFLAIFPWSIISLALDSRYHLSAMLIARRPETVSDGERVTTPETSTTGGF